MLARMGDRSCSSTADSKRPKWARSGGPRRPSSVPNWTVRRTTSCTGSVKLPTSRRWESGGSSRAASTTVSFTSFASCGWNDCWAPRPSPWNLSGVSRASGGGRVAADGALGADAIRPTAETDIALFVQGLSIATPWKGQVFDTATKEVRVQTIGAGKDSESDGAATKVFEVEGADPARHVLLSDGTYLESQVGDLRILGVQVTDSVELALRRRVADNTALEAVLNKKLPDAWSEKKGTYTNSLLSSNLKLPEGWRRVPDREVDGNHFHAFSKDSNAYVSLAVTVLGTGYTLEGWHEGLLETYVDVAVDGEVEVKKTSFAKQDAFSFEFVRAGEATLDSTAFAWSRNGMGFVLTGGTWSGGPTKLHRETSGVMKSFRIAR